VLSLNLKSDRGSQLANPAPNSWLLTAGDVNVTWCTRLMIIGKNFCWSIVTFAWSSQKAEDCGVISFGNQEMRENILNCTRYWENFLISSESTTEWTYQLRFEISVVIIFISLVPKRRHISHKFYQVRFVHCTPNHALTAAGVWPDCRLERTRFVSSRQSGVAGRKRASRIGFSVAAAISNTAAHFYFLIWCLPRLLFCVGSGSNVATAEDL
jgi:hypothetical protein